MYPFMPSRRDDSPSRTLYHDIEDLARRLETMAAECDASASNGGFMGESYWRGQALAFIRATTLLRSADFKSMSAAELLAEEQRLKNRMGKNGSAMLSAGGVSGAAHAYVKFDVGSSEVFFRPDWPSVIAAADAWIDAQLAARDAGQAFADAIGIGG